MKTKSYAFALSMILILLCSVSMATAEDASIGDVTFTIPDGYSIFNQTDNMVVLQQDDDHAITVFMGDANNPATARSNLEAMGYTFAGEESYQYNEMDITQQNYNSENGYSAYCYVVTSGDSNYVITFVTPDTDPALSSDENPVSTILSTIQ